jgi:hypothetical protein
VNDPRNPFSKASKDRPKADPSTATMPPSQRLDRMRGKKAADELQPDSRWRPSRAEDRSINETSSAFTPSKVPTRTMGGKRYNETSDLTQAREAEQERRKALATQVTGQVQTNDYIPANATAMTVGWVVRNVPEVGGTFIHTDWNMAQLVKCMDWQIKSGQSGFDGWGISQLDAAHKFLLENGYYEGETHHRGQAAAKSFPQWVAPQQAAPEPVRSGNKSVFIRQDENAVADARKMTFEEVQAAARAQFKLDNR